MIKAIFMDYYGTVTFENGPISMEVVKRVYKSSSADSPEEVFRCWWKKYKQKLEEYNGENFRTQHDVALDCFKELLEEFSSGENPDELLARMEEHWCTTPVYEDAAKFLQEVSLPVYFVTNSDDRYVYESIKKYDLHPEGVFTSEQAKYSKPRKEIFLYALEQAGVKAEEVIHVGDSLDGDVRCPQEAGIRSIWLNREDKPIPEGVVSAKGFSEVADILKRCQ
ncbi:HAD-IA family hydrolase [Mordavella massiliensis]|uniref:HAD family hydrolase n=1 Tax=Mordavella massiliensis TaxID=1871024 RepID=UPI00210BA901|nr:HAD family hydrolase [Mordavella massiliensis]